MNHLSLNTEYAQPFFEVTILLLCLSNFFLFQIAKIDVTRTNKQASNECMNSIGNSNLYKEENYIFLNINIPINAMKCDSYLLLLRNHSVEMKFKKKTTKIMRRLIEFYNLYTLSFRINFIYTHRPPTFEKNKTISPIISDRLIQTVKSKFTLSKPYVSNINL